MPTFTITTSVLPGGEVRVTAPELKEGQRVEVTVRVPGPAEAESPTCP